MARKDASLSDVILAAGGLVWRDSPRGREIALVHRPKYDDWTLPKGKLDPGERWQDGAVREVEEETGFRVRLGAFAGGSTYLTRRAPKVVLYWHMEVDGDAPFAPHDPAEVDAVEWLSPDEAHRRLSTTRERRVLAKSASATTDGEQDRLARVRPPAWIRRLAASRSPRRSSPRKRPGWANR